MGTDYLRQFVTMLLAKKMKQMMPGLMNGCLENLQVIQEDLKNMRYYDDDKKDCDDLISEQIEKTVGKVYFLYIIDWKI